MSHVSRSAASRLEIRLAPSRQLAGLLVGSHVLAGTGLLASRLPAARAAAALLVLALSLAFSLRRHAWLASARSLVLLDLSDALEVEAVDRSGRSRDGTVLGTTFVAPWLIVINLKLERSRCPRAVVILPDATDRESFRAARVWLRWRRVETRDR
jgi:toxin CptA